MDGLVLYQIQAAERLITGGGPPSWTPSVDTLSEDSHSQAQRHNKDPSGINIATYHLLANTLDLGINELVKIDRLFAG